MDKQQYLNAKILNDVEIVAPVYWKMNINIMIYYNLYTLHEIDVEYILESWPSNTSLQQVICLSEMVQSMIGWPYQYTHGYVLFLVI